MNVAFPLCFDESGRTAQADDNQHIRHLIEQVLFTAPGERVNRPDFGCGLLRLVFEPTGDELAATTQFLVQVALQQWLGDLIQVEDVQVHNQEATVHITVRYLVRRTQESKVTEFTRERIGP